MRHFIKPEDEDQYNMFDNSHDHWVEIKHSTLVKERWIYFCLGVGVMILPIAFMIK